MEEKEGKKLVCMIPTEGMSQEEIFKAVKMAFAQAEISEEEFQKMRLLCFAEMGFNELLRRVGEYQPKHKPIISE